jgi:hypothetical protein
MTYSESGRAFNLRAYVGLLVLPVLGVALTSQPTARIPLVPQTGASVTYTMSQEVNTLDRFDPEVQELAVVTATVADASKNDFMGSYVDEGGQVFQSPRQRSALRSLVRLPASIRGWK